jgi:hypothetical protein
MNKEYLLKHKNLNVMSFFMDDITHKLMGMGKLFEKEHLPFNMQDLGSEARLILQTDIWLKCRGLTESRKDLKQVLKLFGEEDSKSMAVKSLGLNLTDHYWVHKAEDNYKWENVNHFDNPFDTVIQPDDFKIVIDGSVKKPSPNLCVDGSIVKRWLMKGDERVLIKGSRYSWFQEPFNERIASMIMDEFKIPHVNYNLKRTKDNIPYSECACMVDRDREYMNAQWVFNIEDYGMKELYTHYVDITERNGIKDAKERIDEMVAVDFIIGNEDRHWGNFGIIRNPESLKWEKIADIFDNGNCLLYDCHAENLKDQGIDSICKSFEESNRMALRQTGFPLWNKRGGINRVVEIVEQGLKYNERMTSERYEAVLRVTRERVETFKKEIEKKEVNRRENSELREKNFKRRR